MTESNFPFALTFDDVLLLPRKSEVLRAQTDTQTFVAKKLKIKIPVISAAMDTVTEALLAITLGRLGGLGVLHRNCTIQQQVAMVKQVKRQKLPVAAAVGAGDQERALALDRAGIDAIVIDHAHAHVRPIIASAKKIKKLISAQLIVGNIATIEAARDFVSFADALKVGVGPGSICTTRVVAGVGVPQLSAILEVVKVARAKGVPVIADGGIRYSGDAVKALAAGAAAVMLGSLFAGTKEAPGKVVKKNGELFKEYRGMGSLGALQSNRSADRYFQKNAREYVPEGIEALTKFKGPLKNTVEQLVGGIRSGMAYIGAATIAAMIRQARFVRVTNAGLSESHPHSVLINKKAPNY